MSRSRRSEPRHPSGARGVRGWQKRQGELAELAFIYRAAAEGLVTMKPHGDSAAYDVVVDNGRRLLRVQVKSVRNRRRHFEMYQIHAWRGSGKRAYWRGEVDFLAAYVVCDDVWFILPAAVFVGRTAIYIPLRGGRYQKYREAWELLREAAGG